MKKTILFFTVVAVCLVTACTSSIEPSKLNIKNSYTTYTINAGEQYSDNNEILLLSDISEMKFLVKFDSSAIYTAVDSVNQFDINKLYGFSDNNTFHHDNSARIGWRWNNNQLELFGYIYNNTVRSSMFISAVSLNTEITCSIKIIGDKYNFTVDSKTIEMPRTSTISSGYKLFPYFGGDEFAPHTIKILIKDL